MLPAQSVGALGTALGEMVFTTAMTGYQEAVTDPSYLGQLLCFAAPMIGNYGVGPGYQESDGPVARAVVMRRSGDGPGAAGETGWSSWLASHGVVAVEGCDTRRLVRRLRDVGAMRGGVSDELDPAELLDRVRAHPTLDGRDLTAEAAGPGRTLGTTGPRVVAIDCGMKASIARELVAGGCHLDIVQPTATAAEILAKAPAALFLSNGPGDPAAVTGVVETVRSLLGQLPILGICMGHQLLGQALGLTTERLPSGHRGANHPVRRAEDGRVEITVQNHGYAVAGERLPDGVVITRTSLFDGSVEGLAVPELRASSVQYHPEASPGPHDARHVFADFVRALG